MALQTEPVCRHGRTYNALKPCLECVADPGPPPGDIGTSDIDPVDRNEEQAALERAKWLEKLARSYQAHREEMENQDSHGYNSVVKLMDQALKERRFATELRHSRRAIEHDRELMRHDREMADRSKAH